MTGFGTREDEALASDLHRYTEVDMPLTASQQAAINHHDGNLQLIACAGSGKTEVVAQRVAELLKTGKAKPGNIVAFTFTDKAAAELKERIFTRCREKVSILLLHWPSSLHERLYHAGGRFATP